MTTPGTADQDRSKATLRTRDETTDRIRALCGLMSSGLGGRRVTQDELIAALADMGERNPDDLRALLAAPK
jgi:hypothetical protein